MNKTKNKSIVVEQVLPANLSRVWNAITNLDEMKQWYFNQIPEFKPEVGFETKFNVQVEDRNYMHLWKITEVIAEKKIAYTWRFEEYPGEGLVSFELLKLGAKTLLRVTNEGLDSFPSDVPEFTEESCRGGWEYFIKENLKDYLEKASK